MTAETLIEKIRKELGSLDKKAEQAVALAIKILQYSATHTEQQAREGHFSGCNITLEEYKALSREEKSRYHDEAEKLNRRWVENQLKTHNAQWIMVTDGQVVKSGTTLDNFPSREALLEVCQQTGKYPFAFISKSIFAIEEHSTPWHDTREAGDAYPTLTIRFLGNNKHFETAADLDTGAPGCYGALEQLTSSGVVTIHPEDIIRSSEHLGTSFYYYTKNVLFELTDMTGETRRWQTSVVCIDNWMNSPFVAINPIRTMLVGRRVLLNLQPRIILDFATRHTEVQFPTAAS